MEKTGQLTQNKQKNEIWVCVASGPSLSQDQIDILGKYKKSLSGIIGVNSNWQWKYNDEFICTHLYCADPQFYKSYIKDIKSAGFSGKKLIPIDQQTAKKYDLTVVKCIYRSSFPESKDDPIACFHHSGAQAIQVAWQYGATKIILIGYDMQLGNGGKIHWFGNYTKPGLRNTPNAYRSWIKHHEKIQTGLEKKGIEVINCSKITAIPYYKKMDLETCLIVHSNR